MKKIEITKDILPIGQPEIQVLKRFICIVQSIAKSYRYIYRDKLSHFVISLLMKHKLKVCVLSRVYDLSNSWKL